MADDQTIEDRILIERLQNGDLEALGDLYDRYRHQVYRTAVGVTHSTQAAEDILQEVFLRVHTYADRIDGSLPLAPWLYRVTVNLCYTWAKRQNRSKISLDDFIDRLISPTKNAPEKSAEKTEIKEMMQDAIDTLPDAQRAVIVMHYLQGLNLNEIADVMECPVGTVKSRLYHARQNLKEQLGGFSFSSDVAHGYT